MHHDLNPLFVKLLRLVHIVNLNRLRPGAALGGRCSGLATDGTRPGLTAKRIKSITSAARKWRRTAKGHKVAVVAFIKVKSYRLDIGNNLDQPLTVGY